MLVILLLLLLLPTCAAHSLAKKNKKKEIEIIYKENEWKGIVRVRNATADWADYRRCLPKPQRTYERKKKVVNLFVYSTLKCIQGGLQKKRNGYVAA